MGLLDVFKRKKVKGHTRTPSKKFQFKNNFEQLAENNSLKDGVDELLTVKHKKRKAKTLVRRKLYFPEYVNIDDVHSIRPNRLARNGVYEEEMVFIINKRLYRMPLVQDAYMSVRCYQLKEPFFLVIHRDRLSFEEEFYVNVVFKKCPYYKGLIVKTGENKFEMVESCGVSA